MTTLSELINQLITAKAEEQTANAKRLEIEQQITAHPDVTSQLKPEGTASFKELGLSIATGFTRSWDQALLLELQKAVKDEFFPFKPELKEDRKASKVIEERFPDLWTQLAGALTLKPKKPTLTIKEVAK